ncbi:MAG: hypothetical protein WCP21_07735, partial [Armatimonadota bacterium]
MPMSRDLKWALLASLTLHCAFFIAIPLAPKMEQRLTRVIASHVKLVRVPPPEPQRPQVKAPQIAERPHPVVREPRQYRRAVHHRARRRVVPPSQEPSDAAPSVVVAMTPPAEEVPTPRAESEPAAPAEGPAPAEETKPEKSLPPLAAAPAEERQVPEDKAGDPNAGSPVEVKPTVAEAAQSASPAPAAPAPQLSSTDTEGPSPTVSTALAALPRSTGASAPGTVGQPHETPGGGPAAPALGVVGGNGGAPAAISVPAAASASSL